MRIFEIKWTNEDSVSWVSGRTQIEALQTLCTVNDIDITDFDGDEEMVEIPKDKWDDYNVEDEEGNNIMTFAGWMEKNKESDIIAEA